MNTMSRMLAMITIALVAAMSAITAVADNHEEASYKGPNAGNFFITPGFTMYNPPDDSNLKSQGDIGGALGLGFAFTDRFAAEILLGRNSLDYVLPGGSGTDESESVWINFMMKPMKTEGAWQPFLLIGGGDTEFQFDNVQSKDNVEQYNMGVGAFVQLAKRIHLRADVRGVITSSFKGMEPFAFVGLTGVLGNIAPAVLTDTDGDGVPDVRDDCPNTPPGREVGANGCELDSDGDGVVDSADACPGTPAGVAVDGRGCPLDSDGDGVPDYLDKCPDSERGAKVDKDGCYVILEEGVTIDLNLEFDTNSAKIRPGERSKIDKVITFLRQYPEADAVIEGHTDERGAADYNQGLSERRARSVHDYLVAQGVDVGRLSFVGYGEARPKATNDTAAGRQLNRRVSAVVKATRKVRQ